MLTSSFVKLKAISKLLHEAKHASITDGYTDQFVTNVAMFSAANVQALVTNPKNLA
jgi:hypothetical protein